MQLSETFSQILGGCIIQTVCPNSWPRLDLNQLVCYFQVPKVSESHMTLKYIYIYILVFYYAL